MAARDALIVGTASADPQRRMARPRPTLKVTIADLENWLAVAAPGDALEYHRGFLAMDRSVGRPLGDDDGKELNRVADAAMALAQSGLVHLVQRRHGSCDYTYIAIASRSIRRSPDRQALPETAS
jgi:hypothetical protein